LKSIKQSTYQWLTRTSIIHWLIKKIRNTFFPGSALYWERHYSRDGDSGTGSYGISAEYKASVLNQFVNENNIQSVIEFGCGDGNQAMQFHFPDYTGLDVSAAAIRKCIDLSRQDPAKRFFISDEKNTKLKAELSISLDVIYHLVEDEIYEHYMQQLFSAAKIYVIIYAWDVEADKNYHVRHRNFSQWIEDHEPDFLLKDRISQEPYADFFIYQRV
jgi:hypothetical protein